MLLWVGLSLKKKKTDKISRSALLENKLTKMSSATVKWFDALIGKHFIREKECSEELNKSETSLRKIAVEWRKQRWTRVTHSSAWCSSAGPFASGLLGRLRTLQAVFGNLPKGKRVILINQEPAQTQSLTLYTEQQHPNCLRTLYLLLLEHFDKNGLNLS